MISYFRGTGWSNTYHDLQTYRGCSHMASKTFARFRNTAFCNPTARTYTRMWPNRVAGYASGGWLHEPLGMSKSGDCASLLHSETRTKVKLTGDPAYKGF
jgi:hypothetical protein